MVHRVSAALRARSLPRAAALSMLVAFAVLAAALAGPARPAGAQAPAGPGVVLYFFWGDGCPHCAAEKPFLDQLRQRYPQLDVRAYEVWNSADNRALFAKMAAAYGFEPRAVPTTFVGDAHWVGFSDALAPQIERAVAACAAGGCKDAGAGIAPAPTSPAPVLGPARPAPSPVTGAAPSPAPAAGTALPLLGVVDLAGQSLTVATLLIGFADGFNPCSLWALTMLLAITLHTGSRRKVALIGLVYIGVTAGVYALFIAGLFTALSFAGVTGWVRLAIAGVAGLFAAINIKDYFFYKRGVSLTIADERKPGLFRRMRGLVDASQTTPGLIAATAALAVGVSLVEFSCTAGFPMLWTGMLTAQGVGAAAFLGLLALYLVMYQLDELAIFAGAVITLRASKLEERHGRILKLFGGMLMLTLALVMLIDPSAMNSVAGSAVIFFAAIAAALGVLGLHRWVLPRLGVRFGDEAPAAPAQAPRPAAGKREHRRGRQHG